MIFKAAIKKTTLLFIISLLVAGASCKKNKPSSGGGSTTPKSSEKNMVSFVLSATDNSNHLITNINGVIGDSIYISLEEGTDVTALVPTITHTGVSISPAGGTAQNFSSPVVYTVTAEDGTTKKYATAITFTKANKTVFFGSEDGNFYAVHASTGKLKWKFTAGSAIHSSPTIAGNTVYFGCNNRYLYALDTATGALKWKYLTAAPIGFESPAVNNGVVFISSTLTYPGGMLYAVHASSGTLKWSKQVGVPSSPVVFNGKVIVGNAGSVNAYDENTGNIIWQNFSTGIAKPNPAIYNSKVYACGEGKIYCLNADNGNTIWQKGYLSTFSGPTISNDLLYVGTLVGASSSITCLDAGTGDLKWQYTATGPVNGSFSNPVVYNNAVFAGNLNGVFYAIDAGSGGVRWSSGSLVSQIGSAIPSPVAATNVVYTGSYNSFLYAYDASSGLLKWKFATNGAVYAGPCVADYDGNVYHAGGSGHTN